MRTNFSNSLANLVSSHAAKNPMAIAIDDGVDAMRYGELEVFSDRLAELISKIIGRKSRFVMVVAEKNCWVVVCALATFKAGYIYLPVDPSAPKERIDYIVADSSPGLVITSKGSEHLNDIANQRGLRNLALNDIIESCAKPLPESEASNFLNKAEPESPAYCIYTSGSTGKPKGVLISHKSVLSFFDAINEKLSINLESKFLSFSPFHFDATVIDVFHTLYRGGLLCIYPGIIDPQEIIENLDSKNITHFSAFGPLLRIITELSDIHQFEYQSLIKIIVGAEVPDKRSVAHWINLKPDLEVINAYGPTETTVAVTAHVINSGNFLVEGSHPIGLPLQGNDIKLIDFDGVEVTKPNQKGQLIVGGQQLFMGYQNNERESKSRLLRINGNDYYNTGDICSYLSNGNILYIGRSDDEVKISGYRVNLNEIKYAAESISYIKSAEAFYKDADSGEKYIVIAIMALGEDPSDIETDTRFRLRETLPNYMIPRRVYVVQEFPVSNNGKTDRKILSERIGLIKSPEAEKKEQAL